MTQEQACTLIDYLETMEESTNHSLNMRSMREFGYSEEEVDAAAQALSQIAGRDYSVL